jgi:autotransporter-associated beta strand protein
MALTASIANNSANLQTFNMAITMAAGSTTTNNFSINTASEDMRMNGVVSGTNNLVKSGANDLILTAANTYSGGTTLNAGNISMSNNAALGTGAITFASNSSVTALANLNVANAFAIATSVSGTFTVNPTFSQTNTGIISGAGTLVKSGTGTLILANTNNSYSGGTTVNAGALNMGTNNVLSSGAVTVNGSGAVLNIGTFSDTVGAVTLTSGSITGTTGALTGTSFAMNGTGSASAILGGSGATLTKTGALTTTTLSGANTYTGATTIASGALNIQNSTGLGTTAGGVTVNATGAALELQGNISVGAEALTLNGTGVSEAGALRNISGNNTYGGLVTLGSASRINSDSGTLSLTNAATITGNTFGLTVGGAGDTVLNSILGTTSGSLTKDGAGKLTLGGANTFTGLTTVSNGTLAYGVGNALSSGAVTVNGSGAVLDIGTFSDTVGAVTLTSGSITGTTGVLAGSSFAVSGAGSASAILGGSGATLTKTGVGTTTTLSKSNSYTGATTVTSGTLNVATGGSIASSSSTVAAGAAMVVNGTAGAVTLNGSLSGAGTVGALELNNGSSLNPGNSPGLLSASSSKWNAGATYNFQMTSATGTAGANWDLLDVSTLLDLSALSSSAKFNLNIETAGPLSGYDVNTPFAWTFAQSGSLALPSGYAFVSTLVASSIDITSAFNLTFTDASSFAGGVTSGFKIIAYTDPTGVEKIALVPEPSTGSLLLFGFGGLALLRLARRRSVG